MTEPTFREDGLTLEIKCSIDAPSEAVWRCWTQPDLFKEWFCPKPWKVIDADFDLRPGRRMNTVMQGPDGARVENAGVWLEVDTRRRLTFTDAFTEGFVPSDSPFITSYVELSEAGDGRTEMVWGARHNNAEDKQTHLEMGFQEGWSAAAGTAGRACKIAQRAFGALACHGLQGEAPDMPVPDPRRRDRSQILRLDPAGQRDRQSLPARSVRATAHR